MGEQPLLRAHAAAVAGERAVRTDDATTRNDDRDRVRSVRRTDGAHGGRSADARRHVAIAVRLAERNLHQAIPDDALKPGSARAEVDLEDTPHARKVLAKLRGNVALVIRGQ